MSKALKHLLKTVENKLGHTVSLSTDFEKLVLLLSKNGLHTTEKALQKVWQYVYKKEKPSLATLDVLALFVGFQSWQDFKAVFNGEDDVCLFDEDNPEKGNNAKRL